MESTNDTPTPDRPLGYWLRAVDALLDRTIGEALADAELSRRDWMILNALDGRVDAPWLQERLARKGGRLRRFVERGWIAEVDGRWQLTDAGRAERERLSALVDGVRERVAGAVSPEDFATTMASLEAIARELGWSEDAARGFGFGRGRRGFGPRGFGRRGGDRDPDGSEHEHGFGPGFYRHEDGHGHGFGRHEDGHGHGFGPHHRGHGPGFGPRGHGRHGRGCGDDTGFERGFTAGFDAGRAAASATPAA
jgi:hypothetical protein